MSSNDALDALAISDLVHRYADAVCRGDHDAWAATWAPDAVWDIGRGEVRGVAAIVEAFATAMGLFASVVQLAANGSASVHGDEGTGRWYMTEYARTPAGHRVFYAGYYDDAYVRLPDGWRFARRKLTWLYQGSPDLTGTFGPPPGYS